MNMKAIRIHNYGSSDQLKLEDIPQPEIAADEVLVMVYDAGMNPVDWKIREGYLKDAMPKQFPFTIGQDLAGEVAELGKGVRQFRVGEAVFGFASGSYAEYAPASAAEIAVKPESIDFATAASIPTAGLTAWQAIETIGLSSGQVVLIHGAAGGVGSFAVQLAKWKQARVVATASEQDIPYLKSLGVDEVINYKSDRFEEKVSDVDAAIDLVGRDTLTRTYRVVKRGGAIATTVGPINELEAKRNEIRATFLLMKRDGKQLAEVARLIDQRVIKPHVDQVLPLDEAKKAHDLSQTGQAHGKIVLRVA
jgi:NADPH:quinone reductase-like Zn-dependent oxidoreductase